MMYYGGGFVELSCLLLSYLQMGSVRNLVILRWIVSDCGNR